MTWNPQRYLAYEGERLRPALDLLARVPIDSPRTIVDLGCGAGNVTRVLAERWPEAEIVGIDSSEAMLAKARASTTDLPHARFEAADIGAWTPRAPVDLLYSNAALHWLPDHATLLPRIARQVAAGGVLAVQMPRNFDAPSHVAVAETARTPRWSERLGDLVRGPPVASPERYLGWLEPLCAGVDVWETIYLQRLPARDDGEHPVVAFVSGTWLNPFLERLAGDAAARAAFLDDYRARIEAEYPRTAAGGALFAFRRLFIVATMRGASCAA